MNWRSEWRLTGGGQLGGEPNDDRGQPGGCPPGDGNWSDPEVCLSDLPQKTARKGSDGMGIHSNLYSERLSKEGWCRPWGGDFPMALI